ncbi:MAG: hypothetical protein NZ580_05395 [Bacteroidia bacterium]|nr:hypothetical protein [Bacteroidia bacterium]MDW8235929.1 hypothetical protein [Bacteroidia bacterium]
MGIKQAYVILIGMLMGIIHFSMRVFGEKCCERLFYVEDALCDVRQAVRIIYFSSFRQPLSVLDTLRLSPELRAIFRQAPSLGECLPEYGCHPARALLLGIPFVGGVELLHLSPHQAAWFYLILQGTYSLLYAIGSLLLLYESTEGQLTGGRFAAWVLLLLLPPFTGYAHEFGGLQSLPIFSILLFLQGYQKNCWKRLWFSIALAVSGYFADWKQAAFMMGLPLAAILSGWHGRWRFLGLFLATWLPLQIAWSSWVHRWTCRWVLTDPSAYLGITLCEGYRETCWSPQYTHNYIHRKVGELQAFFGMPHIWFLHPHSLYLCMDYHLGARSGFTPYEPDCLPAWAFSPAFSKQRWYQLIQKWGAYFNPQQSIEQRIEIGKALYREVDTLLFLLRQTVGGRVLLYRWASIVYDNLFHPPLYIYLKGERSYGRVPLWLRKAYFLWPSLYIPLVYGLGLFATLWELWLYGKGLFSERQKLLFLLLSAYGWGQLVVPFITGESEWRYFFPPVIAWIGLWGMGVLYLWSGWRRKPWSR